MPKEARDASTEDALPVEAATEATAKKTVAASPDITTEDVSTTGASDEESPVATTAIENPLHKRLGIRPGAAGLIIGPPDDDDNPLLPLPNGFIVLAEPDGVVSQEGQFDYVHFFTRNRAELTRVFSHVRDKLAPGGSLWISWIKQSASHRGGGLPGDLNENTIRRIALTSGLIDVKVAALDHEWSALRLVHRKH